jgi:hypothetical protein
LSNDSRLSSGLILTTTSSPIRALQAGGKESPFARLYRRSSIAVSEGELQGKARAFRVPSNRSKADVVFVRMRQSTGQAINLEKLAGSPVYRADGAPELSCLNRAALDDAGALDESAKRLPVRGTKPTPFDHGLWEWIDGAKSAQFRQLPARQSGGYSGSNSPAKRTRNQRRSARPLAIDSAPY